ncbi:MAG: hypothetical protein PV340_04275 [Wolbachia sp.]|nr:hypothetical protein [Wolbachia sp.]MDD9336089.1 hypothetical protein [Wolbachia sp.]
MAGNLAEYMSELKLIEIICKLMSKEIDVLVGINLPREGLDIPECDLVAILVLIRKDF